MDGKVFFSGVAKHPVERSLRGFFFSVEFIGVALVNEIT